MEKESEDLIYNGMKFPKTLNDKIVAEARDRGIDKTSVVREALMEHFKQREHPDLLIKQMMQAFRDNPEILAPIIKDEVREQVQTQLRQILGEKHRP